MTIPIKNRRIALVGGAGFIGHNLALRLKELGADVHVVDHLQVNNLMSFIGADDDPSGPFYRRIIEQRLRLLREAKVPVHVEDARDYHRLCHLLTDIKPQTIVHLSAVAHANRSNKDPHSTFDHSFRTLENVLDFSRAHAEHVIYLSSSMVYGNFTSGEVTEETACDPLGIYAALKFSGEKLVIAYNQVFDLPYTIIRPSALYGERCISRRVGQIFIENAMKGHEITIQGDGSNRLDFTYIQDFVSGIVLAIEKEEARGEIFNLTYGEGRSLMEMAEILREFFPEATISHKEWDRLMPKRGTLSVEKAKRLLGYNPQFPLEKGFADYIKWYKALDDSDAADPVSLLAY